MRDAAARIALSDVHDPFAENRSFDQRRDQDRSSDYGMRINERLDRAPRHLCNNATAEHLYVVVGFFEKQILKVESFARYVDSKDLARTIASQLVPECIALEQHRTTIGAVSFT